MTTEHIRNALGPWYVSDAIEENARKELRAIEKACIDLYLHGTSGMSDESCTVLQNVGAFAHGEESK